MSIQQNSNPYLEIVSQISAGVYGRDTEITASFNCLLAGFNVAIIGQVGTAKSFLARRILDVLPAPSFSALLHAYSEPEDLLGTISLTELKNDRRIRQTTGYLPTSRFAFLDEIFKARSTTLNCLLTALNERIYIEEGKAQPILLQGVIGCSNEYPDDESGALADRFVLYIPVNYSQDKRSLLRFALEDMKSVPPLIKQDSQGNEIRMITPKFLRDTTAKIDQTMKDNVDAITDIIIKFDNIVANKSGVFKDARLSDRTLIQCARLLATSCVMRQGTDVLLEDAWCFEFLARNPEHQSIYQESCKELLKQTECLDALKERLRKGNSMDFTIVDNAIPKLPLHWQMELNRLIRKHLEQVKRIQQQTR